MINQVYTERFVEQPRSRGDNGAGLARRQMNFESKGIAHEIVPPDPFGNDRANTAAKGLLPTAGREASEPRQAVLQNARIDFAQPSP
jgi:hypothetical protein